MLADQMLSRIQYMHSKNFIHRDIKPENFLMGLGNAKREVFIIDFGLSKRYRDPISRAHIPFAEGKLLAGTARYASLACAQGIEPSRRDDLESLGFVLLYFLKGSLPWNGLPGDTPERKFAQVRDMKARLSIDELCSGLPPIFARYFRIVRSLEFDQAPNYAELRLLFRNLFIRMGFVFDGIYDWDGPRVTIGRVKACSDINEKNKRKSVETTEREKKPRKRVRKSDSMVVRVRMPVPSWNAARQVRVNQ
jgi:serine/threonine protein kinase